MKIIKANAAEFKDFFRELRQRGGTFTPKLLSSVAEIVNDVAVRGDEALFEYTAKFDGHQLTAATVEVNREREKRCSRTGSTCRDLEVIKLRGPAY